MANNATIWLFNIAMENGPFIDGLPINSIGDFPWQTVSHNQMGRFSRYSRDVDTSGSCW